MAFLPSTTVFRPFVLTRRAELMAGMLPPGSSQLLLVDSPEGRLMLSPLQDRDARTVALLRLRDFIALATFRRYAAPGDDDGIAFRLSPDRIHADQPDDVHALVLPAVAFLPVPGPGLHDSLMGGLTILEETKDLYGPGTVVVSYGDWIEPFTIEVIAEKIAVRRGIVAGLEQLLRLVSESNTLRLTLPDWFDSIATFELTDTQYIDDPYAVQNRRRAHLHVTMTVPELFLAQGVTPLKPQFMLEVGLEVDVSTRSVLQQIDPSLDACTAAQLLPGG